MEDEDSAGRLAGDAIEIAVDGEDDNGDGCNLKETCPGAIARSHIMEEGSESGGIILPKQTTIN